jgi:helicase
MAGRAGRPKYDSYGESVLVARTEDEYDFLMDHYVSAEPEDIKSKLASEQAIRFHLLTAIAGKTVSDRKEIDQLIEGTFFSFQFSSHEIDEHVSSALAFLEEGELIGWHDAERLYATPLGEKAAKLYIDPLTAISFRNVLPTIVEATPIGILHLICSTPDEPLVRVAQAELEDYEAFVAAHEDELLVAPPDEWADNESYSKFLAQVKTARMLNDWISERTERSITDDYDVGMGDIYRHVEAAEWLAYSASEIARVVGAWKLVPYLQSLKVRIRDGVLPELLELVSLKGIGRVRGRMLYNHGFKTLSDLSRTSVEQIARVPSIGSTIAESIKRQLGLEVEESNRAPSGVAIEQEGTDSAQTLLEDFTDEES